MTRKQAASQLRYSQHHFCLTASSFGIVAKGRRAKPPIANLVKTLHRRSLDVASLCWGKTHEEDARQAYTSHMALCGQAVAVEECVLVIDDENPCFTCSPDWRVTIDCDRGLLNIKCPYAVAKEGLTPLQTATDIKGFSCKHSTIEQGTREMKCSCDYYQIQGLWPLPNLHGVISSFGHQLETQWSALELIPSSGRTSN